MLSSRHSSLVSDRSLYQTTTSGEPIASTLRLLNVHWFWRGCRHVSRLFRRNAECTWRVSHCSSSIDRSEQRRRFVCFIDMPSVTSQLYMLPLHKVGARLDMRASNDCGLPHVSSLDAQNITWIQLLQRRCTFVLVHILSLLPAPQVTVCIYHIRLQQCQLRWQLWLEKSANQHLRWCVLKTGDLCVPIPD